MSENYFDAYLVFNGITLAGPVAAEVSWDGYELHAMTHDPLLYTGIARVTGAVVEFRAPATGRVILSLPVAASLTPSDSVSVQEPVQYTRRP